MPDFLSIDCLVEAVRLDVLEVATHFLAHLFGPFAIIGGKRPDITLFRRSADSYLRFAI